MNRSENPGKRLTEHTWLIIQGRYERGDSVRAMAREYEISAAAISNRAKKFGWLEQGALKEAAVKEARSSIKDEFASTYREHAKAAIGNHFKFARYVQQIALHLTQIVDENIREPNPARRRNVNREIYQLNILSTTMRSAIEVERQALSMDSIKWDDPKDGFSKFVETLADMRAAREAKKIGYEAGDEPNLEGEEGQVTEIAEEYEDGEVIA